MKNNFKHLLGAALCLLATFRATQAASGHGGGTSGDTGGGTIYYIAATASTAVMTAMNSDGSNKTRLGNNVFGPPSYALHNGHRWFLSTPLLADQYYPDGNTRHEVFAFRDDYNYQTNNNSTTRVQLTDDITLDPWDGDWMAADNAISFIGRRWSSSALDATIIEGGIYTALLVFDSQGNIAGLAAQPVTLAIPLPLIESDQYRVGLVPDVADYSWAPTSDMVAYSNHADTGLWVGDLFKGRIQIFSGEAHMPQWSPLGDKIAFTHGGIYTINPNGKSAKLVVRDTSAWWFSHAYWSPTASFLVFLGSSRGDGSYQNQDLFRAPATGGTPVNVTNTSYPNQEEVLDGQGGWRE